MVALMIGFWEIDGMGFRFLLDLFYFILFSNFVLFVVFIGVLIFIKFIFAGLYLHAVTETKLVVDTSRGETLRINVMFFSMCINWS
jgi:hypothetical protein